MTFNAQADAPQPERPLGISILAVLSAIAVGLALLALVGGGGTDGGALIALLIALVNAFAAYGLWNLRSWAWPLALVGYTLGTIDALLLLTGGVINSNLVVGPVVVLYLLQPTIRALFRREG